MVWHMYQRWNGDVTLQKFKWRKWLGYSFEIAMKVKEEVSIAKGMDVATLALGL
jgi:hypothetical protein